MSTTPAPTPRFRKHPPPPESDARLWLLHMRPADIGYVNCVFAGHEGLGIVRTLDERAGLVEIWVMPGFEDDFNALLGGLQDEMDVRVLKKEQPLDGFPEK